MLVALLAALPLLSSAVAAAASPPSAAIYETRQQAQIPPDAFPVRIAFVGEAPDPLTAEDVVGAAEDAAKAWNEVTCSNAAIEIVGHHAAVDDLDEGVSAVVFETPENRPALTEFVGIRIFSCGGDCGGLPDPSILLNESEFDWATSPEPVFVEGTRLTVDIQAVLTHEFGHMLGLPHVEDVDDVPPDSLATMNSRYILDGGQRTPAASDKLLLCRTHPGGASECSSDSECGVFGACVTAGELSVCQEDRGRIGDYCARDMLICPGRCFVSSATTSTGYCTETCDTDDDCPDDYVCEMSEDDEKECRVFFPERDRGGCATAGRAAPLPWLVWISLLVGVLRSRSNRSGRQSAKSRDSISDLKSS